ncbi:MAG: N-acetyltransferase family protein [Lachnospiraceae bacterium]
MSNSVKIRFATPNDAERLLQIYTYYVLETAVTFEYEVPTLEDFTARIENTLKTFPYLIIEDNQKIVGYAYASTFKPRAAYQWSVEASIYISHTEHGHGYGRTLYDALDTCLRAQNVCNVCSCISCYTDDSEHFHEKLGYKKIARFTKSGFKWDWYDMIWMEKILNPHTNPPKPFLNINEIKDNLIL